MTMLLSTRWSETQPRRLLRRPSHLLEELHALVLRADGLAQAPLRALQVLHLPQHLALELARVNRAVVAGARASVPANLGW